MHLLRITWFRTGCCGLSRFVQCLNIDLQFAPKYVRILVCRLHLFWGAGSFPRAKLEETRTSRNRWCPRTNIRAYLRAKWRLNGVYHPSYVSAARKTECDKWLTVKSERFVSSVFLLLNKTKKFIVLSIKFNNFAISSIKSLKYWVRFFLMSYHGFLISFVFIL